MTRYLSAADVVAIHRHRVFANFADVPPLLKPHELEGAVFRPQATFDGVDLVATIHDKAAALFHALAHDHCFVDGNKRTAVLAAHTFYAMNGWVFAAEPGELVYLAVDAALGTVDALKVAQRFEVWATPMDLGDDSADVDDDLA